VIYLHIRGPVLTVSAAEAGCPVASQPGSWDLPPEFYLHVACYQSGHRVKVSVH
jgi:hypothetical protein